MTYAIFSSFDRYKSIVLHLLCWFKITFPLLIFIPATEKTSKCTYRRILITTYSGLVWFYDSPEHVNDRIDRFTQNCVWKLVLKSEALILISRTDVKYEIFRYPLLETHSHPNLRTVQGIQSKFRTASLIYIICNI